MNRDFDFSQLMNISFDELMIDKRNGKIISPAEVPKIFLTPLRCKEVDIKREFEKMDSSELEGLRLKMLEIVRFT